MNLYNTLSAGIALVLYLPLAWQILTKQVTQNLATFILWGLLDLVVTASIMVQGGNWTLPATYVCGCMIIIGCLIKMKTVKWTGFETLISFMVAVCIIGWAASGSRTATILSTAGVVLAGLPQVVDSFKRPSQQPFLIYVGFVVVNALSVAGGKSWSIEERLYPASCFVLCIVIMLLIGRKFLHVKSVQA